MPKRDLARHKVDQHYLFPFSCSTAGSLEQFASFAACKMRMGTIRLGQAGGDIKWPRKHT
jgi:hypothetical protein